MMIDDHLARNYLNNCHFVHHPTSFVSPQAIYGEKERKIPPTTPQKEPTITNYFPFQFCTL